MANFTSRVDNSESSRNGDYLPSRWEAQSDAVNMIFSAKTQSNPESSVGLMSMGGKGPEMLVTLTTDFGKVLDGMHRTKIRGNAHLATGLQIAALALKHRQNNSQKQRIIVFTCSGIHEEEKELVKLAKKLKKVNISVDLVAFGDLDPDNTKKLEAFNQAVNSGEGSHLEVIPPGPSLLSDHLLSSPILGGDGSAARGAEDGIGGGGESGAGAFEFGVDPSTDPELALALRMSMEEEKARQDKEAKAKAVAEKAQPLGNIPEEADPLLDKNGEASGSGGGAPPDEKKDKEDDADKMDTA
ncbi:hypothetical protein MMC30_006410 [Trapelia coarctata]|nr:hypothetical protein [Trapelia coarctata]